MHAIRTRLLVRAAAIAAIAWALPLEAQAQLRTRVYASGFVAPVGFVQDPTRRSVQYVVEQGGRIRVVQGGTVLPTDFLDLTNDVSTGTERGLLGLAFAPDYAASGRFYVNFTNPNGDTVVARFLRSANPLVADPASRFDLRWGGAGSPRFIAQPFPNHNGGHLAFGPDGFLYIGLGDGGGTSDRPQNRAELLGKMLRIDVNVPDSDPGGYQVPAGNPFLGAPGTRPEIWSFGLRNPWRYSFDDPARGGTGALLLADVGQSAWEEIDYQPPNTGGRNYGWPIREGAHDNPTLSAPAFLPLVDPIHEYGHSVGVSVTGGFVYRGCALGPAYRGRYFFADFTGRVWSMGIAVDPGTGQASATTVIEHTAALGGAARLGTITSFGVDADGELYLASYSRGVILKIESVTTVFCNDGDFDGDGRADITVFRPSNGVWFTIRSAGGNTGTQWGNALDVPVPGDYDGDGKTDIAVFRPSNTIWFIIKSTTGVAVGISWGNATDVPVPADYDGDGRTDLAVFRPSNGTWLIQYSAGGTAAIQWGNSADRPVPADYDGDNKADIAVFRPSNGIWYVTFSSTGTSGGAQWGNAQDVTVPGDYDGDGVADIAVFRPSNGVWFIVKSTTGNFVPIQWGNGLDIPVPGDYDGDGKTDVAVFRPANGTWFIIYSGTSLTAGIQWGNGADVPILKRP